MLYVLNIAVSKTRFKLLEWSDNTGAIYGYMQRTMQDENEVETAPELYGLPPGTTPESLEYRTKGQSSADSTEVFDEGATAGLGDEYRKDPDPWGDEHEGGCLPEVKKVKKKRSSRIRQPTPTQTNPGVDANHTAAQAGSVSPFSIQGGHGNPPQDQNPAFSYEDPTLGPATIFENFLPSSIGNASSQTVNADSEYPTNLDINFIWPTAAELSALWPNGTDLSPTGVGLGDIPYFPYGQTGPSDWPYDFLAPDSAYQDGGGFTAEDPPSQADASRFGYDPLSGQYHVPAAPPSGGTS